MSFQSVTGAWRALSLLCQTAIGSVQPITELLVMGSTEINEPEAETYFVNTDEVTGTLMPTKAVLLNRKFTAKHKAKATPTGVALFTSMALGNDTSTVVGATTAYTHKMVISPAVTELPYRTMVENDGNKQFVFAGVSCSGFTISGSRGAFVDFEADLMGSGAEATDATAKPGASSESYLTYKDCDFTTGGTYNGTAVTGGSSLAARLTDFKLAYKNNAKGQYKVGDASGNLGEIRRGQTASVDLDATVELDATRAERTAFLAGTETIAHIPIIGGVANGTAHFGVDIVFPRTVFKAVKKSVKDGTLTAAGKFQVLEDPTYGSMIVVVTNLRSTSYTATA